MIRLLLDWLKERIMSNKEFDNELEKLLKETDHQFTPFDHIILDMELSCLETKDGKLRAMSERFKHTFN